MDGDELQPDAREINTELGPLYWRCGTLLGNSFAWTYLVTASQVLEIKDGEFTWSKDAQSPTLEGINLVMRKGELTGIVGRVGAGKVRLYDRPELA